MFGSAWRSKKRLAFIAVIILVFVLIMLTILHPMIRTVGSQTITYDIVHFGMAERNITMAATDDAFALWKNYNPGLVFEKGGGGMNIVFTQYPLVKDGLAVCPFWNNSTSGCYVLISLDTNNRYPYPDHIKKNILANTLAHEIGHVLGMMHANTYEHLMFGPVFGWAFDDRGFTVPKRLNLDV